MITEEQQRIYTIEKALEKIECLCRSDQGLLNIVVAVLEICHEVKAQ